MICFSKTLRTAALTGLFGLGFAAAMTTPALADRAYTRCDRDGDRCWRVVCDDDGDRCRTYSTNTDYYGYNNYNGDYDHRYYRNYYRHRDFDNSSYSRWVCDRDGDRCHWSYGRW